MYDPARHRQRFFLGHDDDVTSLAIHPDRTLVATGQLGANPYVCIWNTATMEQVVRLSLGEGARSITALAFSPDGGTLATVTTDNAHTITLWDWRRGSEVSVGKTAQGTPPTTYGVVWSPFEPRIVTYGVNSVGDGPWSNCRGVASVPLGSCRMLLLLLASLHDPGRSPCPGPQGPKSNSLALCSSSSGR